MIKRVFHHPNAPENPPARYYKIIDEQGIATFVGHINSKNYPATPEFCLMIASGCEKIEGDVVMHELTEDEIMHRAT